jgi:hypothetical protein
MKAKRFIGPSVAKRWSALFLKISRSISAQASCARKCLFSCSRALLPARRAAHVCTARTQRPSSASLMPSACATRVAACPSCIMRRTTSARKAASYLVLGRLPVGFSASMTRESYFRRVHFYPTTSLPTGLLLQNSHNLSFAKSSLLISQLSGSENTLFSTANWLRIWGS